MARRLLIATTNPHKVEEFRGLLAGLPFELVSLTDVGVSADVEETGTTFAENAIIKAVAYAGITGLPALADDSGLEIDALDGAPGLHSARWAGPDVTYAVRNRLIVDRLAGLSNERRGARYRCAIAVAAPAPRGLLGVVEGILEGQIAEEPAGEGGFGYDPIFLVPEDGRTVGQMSADEKSRISHRARAAQAARPVLAQLTNEADHMHEAGGAE
jgi:XTP/dITP diphosphohydrolase